MYQLQHANGPKAIFVDGVKTFWAFYTDQMDDGTAYVTWNLNQSVAIEEIKIRAEEFSNYRHFAKDIILYCGMDENHKKYDYGIKLKTIQKSGWQYVYNIDKQFYYNNKTNKEELFSMIGKYWKIKIVTNFGRLYGEIAQIDFRGYPFK